MKKMDLMIDMDGIILRTPFTKSRLIGANHSDWRELLAEEHARRLKAVAKIDGIEITAKEAHERGNVYANAQPFFPPWLTDRYNCIPIIGKDNYEDMSSIVYGMETPMVDGVREGLMDLVNEGHKLSIATHRRPNDFDVAAKIMKENGVLCLFRGEYHLIRGQDSKVNYGVSKNKDGHVDDEARCLIGDVPRGFLKALIAVAFGQISDPNNTTRIDEKNGPIPLLKLVKDQGIEYHMGFQPYFRDTVNRYAAQR